MSDQPVLNLLKFQRLNSATSVWDDFASSLLNVSVTRGGVTTVDVGTLTAVLEVDSDPLQSGLLVPNQPVRIIVTATSTPIFTGTILDVDVNRVRDTSTRSDYLEATVTAVDAVAALGSLTVDGAVNDDGSGFESWANRIIRLAASSPTDVEMPADDSPVVIYSI